jgi:hypothetical protein
MKKPVTKATLHVHGVPRKPVIYFAGKINKNDWCKTVPGDYRPGAVYAEDSDDRPKLWNPDWRLDCGTFFYGGPFFVSCDHGCGHRLNAHGANGGLSGDVCGNEDRLAGLHQSVWDVSCARIQRANLVFVYVNETDCFGTLVEIGIAAASNKAIFLALGPDLSKAQRADLWMPQAAAIKVYSGTAKTAWQALRYDLDLI